MLSVCAIFINTGPNRAMPSRSFFPRVRRSKGIPIRSSYCHVAYTLPITDNTSAMRPASSVGLFEKYAPISSIFRVNE